MSDRKLTFEVVALPEDESIARQFAEWFFKTYAPSDPVDAARFHADLFTLVRQQMSLVMSLSLPPNGMERRKRDRGAPRG